MTELRHSLRKFLIHKVLHADDTPHRLALGVAIGIFIGFTPLVGLQMLIALALATLFKANKAVAVPMVWISNPFTFVPMYVLCLQLGNGLIGSSQPVESAAILDPLQQLSAGGMGRLLEGAFWSEFAVGMARVGLELWVGCLLAGFVFGTLGYFISRQIITAHRQRRRDLFRSRAARRAERRLQKLRKRVPARGPLV